MCSGDYIFQIDADEVPNRLLIKNLPKIIESNPELSKLSREKLAEALNKDKNIKYMSEQFLEYIGPEYQEFITTANYNLLGI